MHDRLIQRLQFCESDDALQRAPSLNSTRDGKPMQIIRVTHETGDVDVLRTQQLRTQQLVQSGHPRGLSNRERHRRAQPESARAVGGVQTPRTIVHNSVDSNTRVVKVRGSLQAWHCFCFLLPFAVVFMLIVIFYILRTKKDNESQQIKCQSWSGAGGLATHCDAYIHEGFCSQRLQAELHGHCNSKDSNWQAVAASASYDNLKKKVMENRKHITEECNSHIANMTCSLWIPPCTVHKRFNALKGGFQLSSLCKCACETMIHKCKIPKLLERSIFEFCSDLHPTSTACDSTLCEFPPPHPPPQDSLASLRPNNT